MKIISNKILIFTLICCLCMTSLITPYMAFAGTNVTSNLKEKSIKTIENYGFDVSKTVNMKFNNNKLSFSYKFADKYEKVTMEKKDGYTNWTFNDGKIKNNLLIYDNGNIILDGNKVEITGGKTEYPTGTVWKSTYKGVKPYGNLTSKDYSNLLTSGKQDIKLGKAIDIVAVGTICTLLGATKVWLGIALGIIETTAAAIKALQADDPKSTALGCKYRTYTHGSDDYQYVCDYYANVKCTGKYTRAYIYEHFVIK